MQSHYTMQISKKFHRNVVFITNCVWAAAAEDSQRNRLHTGIQSDVDGEQQRLEPFYYKLTNAKRRHFEQV